MTFKDLSHLPKPSDEKAGLLPDPDPEFVTPLVEWLESGVDEDIHLKYELDKPQVSTTLTRHSSAASCMKKVALIRDGVPQEKMDGAGISVTAYGTIIHEMWQRALEWKWPGRFDFEVGSVIGDLTSGSCDALEKDGSRGLELKSKGGFQYKFAVGERGAAQGPKSSEMVQLALNVMGHDAESGTLIYLATESISGPAAARKGIDDVTRFGAQWTFTRDQLQPLADEWLAQLEWIRDHPTTEVPRYVPHEMPKGARLNPESGAWTLERGGEVVDSGAVWSGSLCTHYCPVPEPCRKRFAEGE